MKFNLENKGSNKTIPIEIPVDKVNIFIYGRNGSGKTTFSRLS